jgi:hypothetical protein
MKITGRTLQAASHRRWQPRLLLLLGLIGLVLASGALAGARQNERAAPRRAKNLNREPTLHFARGTLQRDGHHGWLLGQQRVVFTRDSIVRDELTQDERAAPREGRIAIVTGARVGGTLIVRQAELLDPWSPGAQEVSVVAVPGTETEVLPPVPAQAPR